MDDTKENKIVIDDRMLLRIGLAIGYGFAPLLRGIRQGLEDYEIEEAARDMMEEEAAIAAERRKAEEAEKTEIYDCRKCWCDQCAKIEDCRKSREGALPDGIRPYPCLHCGDGMRFKPLEGEPCEDFVQGAGANNG